MEVKEEKRPIWGIDKYLHFVVLGLSTLNLLQLFLTPFNYIDLNEICSILLSLVGLFSFWLIYKNKHGGELTIFIWSILQFVIFINYPSYSIDLSQGFSIPIGITSESSIYGYTDRQVSFSINIVAGILTSAAYFRLRNKKDYMELIFTPKSIENIDVFTSKILKAYSFGKDKRMLILAYTSESKSYAIQVNKNHKLDFIDSEIEYLLYEIDTKRIKEESLKPYDFKQLGNIKITPPNT
ncbi:MAG: hypothetical protein COB15_08125 [Flavobacteriales bacterium]|nr:MAG: hypothetical protein COB15_08125 [Flavobacteriales bacterium]